MSFPTGLPALGTVGRDVTSFVYFTFLQEKKRKLCMHSKHIRNFHSVTLSH
jgi:hypothetical protein